jgi:hypothetical protein
MVRWEIRLAARVGGKFLALRAYRATAGASTSASAGSAVTAAVASTVIAVASGAGVLAVLVAFAIESSFVMTHGIEPREKSGTGDFAGVGRGS